MKTVKKRNRQIAGVKVTFAGPYALFGWRGRHYKWCRLGHLEDTTNPENVFRLGTFKRADMAVCYVLGIWVGSDAWVKNDPKDVPEAVKEKGPPPLAGQEQHGSL